MTKKEAEAPSVVEKTIVSLIASVLVMFAGMIYFIVTLWIIKVGSALLGYTPESNWVVLSASILAVGAIMGTTQR